MHANAIGGSLLGWGRQPTAELPPTRASGETNTTAALPEQI